MSVLKDSSVIEDDIEFTESSTIFGGLFIAVSFRKLKNISVRNIGKASKTCSFQLIIFLRLAN